MGKAMITAVVGAGGKTTFIERAAEIFLLQGKKTAVMTTTHMWIPSMHSAVGKTVSEAVSQMEREGIVYFGHYAEEEGKMSFPGQKEYEILCRQADRVLVEADGAKRLPMKMPDWSREPVIPNNTDNIVVVFGLSALGKPLHQVCHRAQASMKAVLVTEEAAVKVLEETYLTPICFRFPYTPLILLLNQADTDRRERAGKQIKQILENKGWNVQVMQLKQIQVSVIYMASGFSRRFGRNKLLEEWKGKPLYLHGLSLFLSWKKELEKKKKVKMELVLVSQYPEILRCGREQGICTVENPSASEGITASIRLGVEAAGKEADYYLFSVADQPCLTLQTMEGFLETFLNQMQENGLHSKTIACLSENDQPGNPVIFHRKYREELLALTGDKGGSQVIRRHPEELMRYPAEKKELADMDEAKDMQLAEGGNK